MNTFVLDCSVAMSWCFIDEETEKATELLDRLRKNKAIVPSIWGLEIINVLGVAERKGRLTTAQSHTFIGLLDALPIEVDFGLDGLQNKSLLSLIRKHNISSYDAAYLELALRHSIPLASFDKLLCKIASKEAISIY